MKKRYLLVVENKETGELFLHSPFKKGVGITPEGFRNITNTVPMSKMIEDKYGNLPLLEV